MEKLIGLIRVSTGKQAMSGLGLEAQTEALDRWRANVGGEFLKIYEEVESGKHKDIKYRPKLRDAVAHAKRSGATLVIAKIDRLVRSTSVMDYLKRSRIKFVACDNPYANELMIDILVAIAANEARQISDRTKAALDAYKRNNHVSKRIKAIYPEGVPPDVVELTAGKLGSSLPQCRDNLKADGRKKGTIASAESRKLAAAAAYEDILPTMRAFRAEGLTLKQIAARLAEEGHTTRNGKPWNAEQVRRVLRPSVA